jgi:tetratricopeptide (TPR) repeat protein
VLLMTRRRASLLLATTLLALGTRARPAAARTDSDFWINIAQPGRRLYEEHLRRGRAAFDLAVRFNPPVRAIKLQEALTEFRQAVRCYPSGGEGYYWLGRTAYLLDAMNDTIAAFGALRRLLPASPADEVSICSMLGIAYSKLGRYEESVEEYNRADRLLVGDAAHVADRAVWHANAAESLMAMGRLEEAIQRYQESVTLQANNVLAWWGLAVASDRDGQAGRAREAIQRALALDPSMSRLTDRTVFFVPDGDIHYYFALGYAQKGNLDQAKGQMQSFLTKLGNGPWAHRARQHLAELDVVPAARAKRLAPFPKAQSSEADKESVGGEQSAARYRIQGYLYRVRQCYQNELKKHPTLAGQLRLGITIAKDGRPQEIKVLSNTLKRPSLQACVVGTIRGISFNKPASGATLKFVFPIEFKPIVQ